MSYDMWQGAQLSPRGNLSGYWKRFLEREYIFRVDLFLSCVYGGWVAGLAQADELETRRANEMNESQMMWFYVQCSIDQRP
mmetsp:Transcript_30903/g.92631  ORF Transcript_30903/g.92631 Transcript_30903/m.92631 type:complete len:81 (-) Transcript_30903:604-846(-)